MTDTEKLFRRIDECGFKRKFIAKHLGIAYNTFWAKASNTREFTVGEVQSLKKLLGFSDKETKQIFFADVVDK